MTPMTEKDKKFIAYWETVIRRGRMKYALLNGLLFGFTIFLFTFMYSFFFDAELDEMYKVPRIFVSLMVYWVAGMVFEGGYTWWMNSKRYKKLTSNPE